MGEVHELGDVDVFTTGTLGQPGQRVFFLQARANGAIVTLKCEKQQVDALAVYLGQLLADLPDPEDLPLPSSLDLVEPLDPLFVLGGISVEWDQRSNRVVLTFEEVIVVDEDADADTLASLADGENDHASVQLRISRGQALAFSRHGTEVVTAGRPTCRFCGLPKDLDGHPCPRMN
jgi:uncharacterized repeat protein (TIGR03847 family)